MPPCSPWEMLVNCMTTHVPHYIYRSMAHVSNNQSNRRAIEYVHELQRKKQQQKRTRATHTLSSFNTFYASLSIKGNHLAVAHATFPSTALAHTAATTIGTQLQQLAITAFKMKRKHILMLFPYALTLHNSFCAFFSFHACLCVMYNIFSIPHFHNGFFSLLWFFSFSFSKQSFCCCCVVVDHILFFSSKFFFLRAINVAHRRGEKEKK